MAFGWGAPAATTPSLGGFGSTTPGAPAATGFSIGSNPGATTGFGGGTMSFGSTASTSQPSTGFGGFSGFGTAPATTSAPSAFGGFGAGFPTATSTASAPAPSFGGFGTTTGTGAFGTGAFGATATSSAAPAPLGGFGTTFGASTAATTASTGFGGFSGFGATTTSAPSTGFGFTGLPGPTTTMSSLGFSGFGQPAGSSLFPSAGTLGTGGGLFGSSAPFGQASGTLGAQQQQQLGANNLSTIVSSIWYPSLFGDERDNIIAKWNRLLAFWGVGKGYYSTQAPPVEFTPENTFCRFKAIGYSCLPTAKNEDGLLIMIINKKDTELVQQQQQLVDYLHRILGSKPTVSVCVEGVKPVQDNRTEVLFYVLERAPTGAARRVPSTEMFIYFSQPNIRSQLQGMGVETIVPDASPTQEQLKQYLETPPAGIDPLVWEQAKLDNPDPQRLVPVPMIGFSELQRRLKGQVQETQLHQTRLELISKDVQEVQRGLVNSSAKITELKRKHLDIAHRVLKVMARQEVCRKMGLGFSPEEEHLRGQLEAIQAALNAPNQFKSRLNELMAQIRMQSYQPFNNRDEEKNTLDPVMQEEFAHLLKQQQQGIQHLMAVLKKDFEDLSLITKGLNSEVGGPLMR